MNALDHISTTQRLPKGAGEIHHVDYASPLEALGSDATAGAEIIYYDYDEVQDDGGLALMDSNFILRSDGTRQKLSSIDFSKAFIFNISEQNASLNSSDLPGEEDVSTARTVAAVFFSLFFLVGLLGNLLVIYTVWRFSGMRRVTYFFLVNLAVTNLIYLLLGLPTITVSYLKMDWPFGDPFCKIDNYVMSVSMSVSILTIMATGFDRYLAVVYPVRSRHIRTKSVSLVVICASWVASLAVMVPRGLLYATQPWLHYSKVPTTLCTRVASPHTLRLDTGLRFGLLYLLPLAVLIVCHLRIGWALWTRSLPRSLAPKVPLRRRAQRSRRPCQKEDGRGIEEVDQGPREEQELDADNSRACLKYTSSLCGPRCVRDKLLRSLEDAEGKENTLRPRLGSQPPSNSSAPTVTAIKIVFALTAVFAFGWLPLHLHYLAEDFGLIDSLILPQFLNGGTVALLFCFGANALNPLLYCVFSTHFRRHFRKAIDQCCFGFFKTTNTNTTVVAMGSYRSAALGNSSLRSRLPESCGRPLLLRRDKSCWMENIEQGESSHTEDIVPRRLPTLQPRPASLLCEDMGSLHLVRQHLLTLPGECIGTHLSTTNARQSPSHNCSSASDRSIDGAAHKTKIHCSNTDTSCHRAEITSSSLELQRYQDISPVSVKKINEIQISPGESMARERVDDDEDDPNILSQTSALIKENDIGQYIRRKRLSYTSDSCLDGVWAWPSHYLGNDIKRDSSENMLALRPLSHEVLMSEHGATVSTLQPDLGSSPGHDTLSSSSGFSSLNSQRSEKRLNKTKVIATNETQERSNVHGASNPSNTSKVHSTEAHNACSQYRLPRLNVQSIFSRRSSKTRNPSSNQRFYSKDSATSTSDLNNVDSTSNKKSPNEDISNDELNTMAQHPEKINDLSSMDRTLSSISCLSAHHRLSAHSPLELATFEHPFPHNSNNQSQGDPRQQTQGSSKLSLRQKTETIERAKLTSDSVLPVSCSEKVRISEANKSYVNIADQNIQTTACGNKRSQREPNGSNLPSVD